MPPKKTPSKLKLRRQKFEGKENKTAVSQAGPAPVIDLTTSPAPPRSRSLRRTYPRSAKIPGSFRSPYPRPAKKSRPTTVIDLVNVVPSVDLEAYLKTQTPLPRLSGPPLTPQQLKIITSCGPPNISKGCIVRVTAAAGTGKTTTLQKAVTHLVNLGHTKVVYVTFNKSAAEDAR